MRYFRIFLLHFQNLLAHRGRSVVWTIIYVINSLVFLSFIHGVFEGKSQLHSWTLPTITSYYFLLIAAAGFLVTHPEENILRDDIEGREIDGRLLKPFSYYWLRFFYELPYRIFQGMLGLAVSLCLFFVFGNFLSISNSPQVLVLSLIIILLAYFISFTMKIIVGMIGFWTTDIRGLRELIETTTILFAGFLMPLNMLPEFLEKVAYMLPFSYIVYFPIIALQGKLVIAEMIQVICIQLVWLLGFYLLHNFLWKKALRQLVSVGQ